MRRTERYPTDRSRLLTSAVAKASPFAKATADGMARQAAHSSIEEERAVCTVCLGCGFHVFLKKNFFGAIYRDVARSGATPSGVSRARFARRMLLSRANRSRARSHRW